MCDRNIRQRIVSRMLGCIEQKVKIAQAINDKNEILLHEDDFKVLLVYQVPAANGASRGVVPRCETAGSCDDRLQATFVASKLPI